MDVKAQLNQLRMAPRKVRLVANLIKGLHVEDAKIQLELLTKKSSEPLLKLLNSAIANAKNNHKLDGDDLVISKIVVNGGPTIKRWFPRAMGRAFPIKKRTCDVILTLSEIEDKSDKKESKTKARMEEKKVKTEKHNNIIDDTHANVHAKEIKKEHKAKTEEKVHVEKKAKKVTVKKEKSKKNSK